MKVLSKYLKVAFSFIAFAFAGLLFAICPTTKTYALLTYTKSGYELAINAVQIKSKIGENDEFKIPLLTGKFDDNYTVRVTDPAGQVHDYVVNGTDNDTYYFTRVDDNLKINALVGGKYKVNYILSKTSYDAVVIGSADQAKFDAMKSRFYTEDAGVYTALADDAVFAAGTYYTKEDRTYVSKTYEIAVEVPSYSIKVDKLVKTKVGVSTSAVEIPYAHVLKADGENLKDGDNNVETTITVKYKTNTTSTPTERASLTDITDEDYFVKVGGKYYIVPSEAGSFNVTYSYNYADSKQYTIVVEDDFNATATELSYSAITIPSFQLGDTVTLPNPTINSSLVGNNIEYNLTKIRIQKEDNDKIYTELTNGETKFTLDVASFNHTDGTITFDDLKGNYTITYTVEDAYGNTKDEVIRRTNVTLSESSVPTVYMACNYSAEDVANDTVDTGYAADFKINYLNNAIVLPAIYANDKVVAYEDLLFVRAIKNTTTNKVYYIDNYKVEKNDQGVYVKVTDLEDSQKNASGDTNIGKVNKVVKFAFADGEADETNIYDDYKLIYEVYINGTNALPARQNALYRTGSSEYTFAVVSTEKTSTPEIEITNLGEEFTTGETVEIKFKSSDSIDTRLKNAVYYYYTDSALDIDAIKAGIEGKISALVGVEGYGKYVIGDSNVLYNNAVYGDLGYALVEADESGKYNVTFSNPTASKVVIVVATINDNGTLAVDAKQLTVKDTEEAIAPTATINNAGDLADAENVVEKRFNQGTEVTLPTITFADADTTLSLNVYAYRDSIENSVKIYNNFNYNNIIKGGKIKTDVAGTYYVVYTATDDAGNTTAEFFSFIVNDNSKPVIDIKVSGDYTTSGTYYEVEQGESLTISSTLFESDRKTKRDELVDINLENDGNNYDSEGNKFTFLDADATYTFTFSGQYTDIYGNDRVANNVVITIKTTKPTLSLPSNISVPKSATKGEPVYLDVVTTDKESVCKPKVTLNSTSGTEKDVELVTYQNSLKWKFTPDVDNATYYVVYTATNAYTSVSSSSYQIKVGDDVPPTISVANKSAIEADLTYDGENEIEIKYTINTTDRTLKVQAIQTGSGDVIYNVDTGLTLSDIDHKGNSTSVQTLWNKLSVSLTSEDGTVRSGDTNQYFVKGNGTYTLTIKTSDGNNNDAETKVSFKLVSNSSVKEKNDTVVGVVLIVISLVILAGVIAFFAFTGKKGGKVKSSKKSKSSKSEAEVEETEAQESEAKEAEVEDKDAE